MGFAAMTYFNTTHETNSQLDVFCKQSNSHDTVIFNLFLEDTRQIYTPSEVLKKLIDCGKIGPSTPLTSIRRSMTSLTKEGILFKLEEKTIGPYNRPEHYWAVYG